MSSFRLNVMVVFFLVVVSSLTISCSTRPMAADGIPSDDVKQLAAGPVFADPSLSGDLEVGSVQATRLASGKLRLRIPLNNVSGEFLQVLVRVAFEDDAGYGIKGDVTPDERVGLPQGTTWHTVESLRQNAARYKIQIRRYDR